MSKPRPELLDAALTVFTRYGFRKASMDEVARAAHLSRQGLYLHFATKEELFVATLQHVLETSLAAAVAALADAALPLETRLVRAFDACVGRYVGLVGPGASDLAEAGHALAKPMVAAHEQQLADELAKAIRASKLAAAYKPAGLTARQLADTLHATARGLKTSSASREAFVEQIGVAVRALCAPLPKRGRAR